MNNKTDLTQLAELADRLLLTRGLDALDHDKFKELETLCEFADPFKRVTRSRIEKKIQYTVWFPLRNRYYILARCCSWELAVRLSDMLLLELWQYKLNNQGSPYPPERLFNTSAQFTMDDLSNEPACLSFVESIIAECHKTELLPGLDVIQAKRKQREQRRADLKGAPQAPKTKQFIEQLLKQELASVNEKLETISQSLITLLNK